MPSQGPSPSVVRQMAAFETLIKELLGPAPPDTASAAPSTGTPNISLLLVLSSLNVVVIESHRVPAQINIHDTLCVVATYITIIHSIIQRESTDGDRQRMKPLIDNPAFRICISNAINLWANSAAPSFERFRTASGDRTCDYLFTLLADLEKVNPGANDKNLVALRTQVSMLCGILKPLKEVTGAYDPKPRAWEALQGFLPGLSEVLQMVNVSRNTEKQCE